MNDASLFSKIVSVGVSRPYASQLATGARSPSLPMAIRIYRAIGVKLGPLVGATSKDIDALERVAKRRAA